MQNSAKKSIWAIRTKSAKSREKCKKVQKSAKKKFFLIAGNKCKNMQKVQKIGAYNHTFLVLTS